MRHTRPPVNRPDPASRERRQRGAPPIPRRSDDQDRSAPSAASAATGNRPRRVSAATASWRRRVKEWPSGTRAMCAVVACGAAVAVFGLAAGMRLGNGRPTPTAPGPPSLSEPVPATSSAISSAGSPAAETSHGGSAFDGWSELAKTVVLVMACPGSGLAVDVDCSSGSGTVVGDGRHVLTNHHVVYADGAPHRYLYVWFADSFDVPPSRQ